VLPRRYRSRRLHHVFEFRQSMEFIKLISLLDVDEVNTLAIKVTYNGGATVVINTPIAGDNGFVSLPIDANLYERVQKWRLEKWISLGSYGFESYVMKSWR